mmetsp:Transcript_46707/g.134530  ORF Transcript_46707/g.134530 Transcript_46707/m.134530 type:complete len:244 (+) Transcript_46707:188-919(+)
MSLAHDLGVQRPKKIAKTRMSQQHPTVDATFGGGDVHPTPTSSGVVHAEYPHDLASHALADSLRCCRWPTANPHSTIRNLVEHALRAIAGRSFAEVRVPRNGPQLFLRRPLVRDGTCGTRMDRCWPQHSVRLLPQCCWQGAQRVLVVLGALNDAGEGCGQCRRLSTPAALTWMSQLLQARHLGPSQKQLHATLDVAEGDCQLQWAAPLHVPDVGIHAPVDEAAQLRNETLRSRNTHGLQRLGA